MTPYELHQAVKKGDLHHVSELLSAPRSDIDVNERDGIQDGIASNPGSTGVLRYLSSYNS